MMSIPRVKHKNREQSLWSARWLHALTNVPSRRKGGGSRMVLAMLLGYSVKSPTGNHTAGNRIYNCIIRGSKPRNLKQQELLKMLASNNGKTIAKAIAIKRRIDLSEFPYWR